MEAYERRCRRMVADLQERLERHDPTSGQGSTKHTKALAESIAASQRDFEQRHAYQADAQRRKEELVASNHFFHRSEQTVAEMRRYLEKLMREVTTENPSSEMDQSQKGCGSSLCSDGDAFGQGDIPLLPFCRVVYRRAQNHHMTRLAGREARLRDTRPEEIRFTVEELDKEVGEWLSGEGSSLNGGTARNIFRYWPVAIFSLGSIVALQYLALLAGRYQTMQLGATFWDDWADSYKKWCGLMAGDSTFGSIQIPAHAAYHLFVDFAALAVACHQSRLKTYFFDAMSDQERLRFFNIGKSALDEATSLVSIALIRGIDKGTRGTEGIMIGVEGVVDRVVGGAYEAGSRAYEGIKRRVTAQATAPSPIEEDEDNAEEEAPA